MLREILNGIIDVVTPTAVAYQEETTTDGLFTDSEVYVLRFVGTSFYKGSSVHDTHVDLCKAIEEARREGICVLTTRLPFYLRREFLDVGSDSEEGEILPQRVTRIPIAELSFFVMNPDGSVDDLSHID